MNPAAKFLVMLLLSACLIVGCCLTQLEGGQPDGNGTQPAPAAADVLPDKALQRLGTSRFRVSGHNKTVRFIPGTDTLLVGSEPGRPRLYDAGSGRLLRSIASGMNGRILSDVSGDGHVAVLCRDPEYTGNSRGHAVELRIQKGSRGRRITWSVPFSDQPRHFGISPDRTQCLVVSSRWHAVIRDCATASVVAEARLQFPGVRDIAWSPDGTTVAMAGRSGILLWSFTDPQQRPLTVIGFAGGAEAICFSNHGRWLAAAALYEPAVHVFDTSSRRSIKLLSHPDASPGRRSLCFSPDDRRLFVPNPGERTIDEYDLESEKRVRSLHHRTECRSVDINSAGTRLVAAGPEEALAVWDLPGGINLTDKDPGHDTPPKTLVFSQDGKSLFTGTEFGELHHWNCQNGHLITSIGVVDQSGDPVPVDGLAASADGRRLAALCHDDTLRVWDLKTGRELARHPGHGQTGGGKLMFLPGSQEIMSFGKDQLLRRTQIGQTQSVLADLKREPEIAVLRRGRIDRRTLTLPTTDGATRYELLAYRPPGAGPPFVLPDSSRRIQAARILPDSLTSVLRVRQGHRNTAQLVVFEAGRGQRPASSILLSDGQAWLSDDGKTCLRLTRGFHSGRDHSVVATVYQRSRQSTNWTAGSLSLPGDVVQAQLSPDGRTIATALEDTTILLWPAAAATPHSAPPPLP